MVYVKGGTYIMGATSEQEEDCDEDEQPVHEVTLSDFYIGKYPVTQAQWKVLMDDNQSKFIGEDLPVECVSQDDVQLFIKKLNTITGQNYRLPTEAEWEYAARGGNWNSGYKYSGSNDVGEVAWCDENSGGETHPVGTKKANELGIYDMRGNVWEWVSDWYGEYAGNAQVNPQGKSEGSSRVCRGGSYIGAGDARVSYRNCCNSDSRDPDLGFRLAFSPNTV
jgi:formylglycine-generating enzyme required for sulfatase activity